MASCLLLLFLVSLEKELKQTQVDALVIEDKFEDLEKSVEYDVDDLELDVDDLKLDVDDLKLNVDDLELDMGGHELELQNNNERYSKLFSIANLGLELGI